jgi:hypothetical protein
MRSGAASGAMAHTLYPAMPYVSYALLTDEDVKALYAYFTKAVPTVDERPAKTTSLPFPYNLRFSMLFWNAPRSKPANSLLQPGHCFLGCEAVARNSSAMSRYAPARAQSRPGRPATQASALASSA